LDALKASTTGRRGRGLLYYFGAIRDDNNNDLLDGETTQEYVDSRAKAGTRVIVQQIPAEEAANIGFNGRRYAPPLSRHVMRTMNS
jgi:hypothetical protein